MWLFGSFITGILSFHLSQYFPLIISLGLIILTTVLLIKRKALPILVILIVFLYASLRVPPRLLPFECDDTVIQGIVTDIPQKIKHGYMQKIKAVDFSNCDNDLQGREINLFSSVPLNTQTRGTYLAHVIGRNSFRNPHSYNRKLSVSARVQEIYALSTERNPLVYIQAARIKLKRYFEKTFSDEVAGFLESVIIGYKKDLPDHLRKSFSSLGLAHLLAISGLHFGIFSFLIFSISQFLIKRLPYRLLNRLTLHLTPSELSALISLPFITYYLFLSGAGIPAIRSFIMVNVFLFSLLLARKGTWKNTISFTACVMLIFSPDTAFEISFLLSFVAVISIGFALELSGSVGKDDTIPFIEQRAPLDKIKTWLKNAFIVSASAYLGTLPLTMYFFHTISTVSIISNLIVAPFICFLLIPFTLFGSFLYLIAGVFPFPSFVQSLSLITINSLGYLSRIPYISLPVAAFPLILVVVFFCGLILLIKQKTRIYGISVALLSFVIILAYPSLKGNSGLEITFLDAGQAESTVIVLPDKKIIVVDTGKNGKQTTGYLDYLALEHIDSLILTHAGNDHAGGLYHVAEMKKIYDLIDNGLIIYPSPFPYPVEHLPLKRGDIITGEKYRLEFLHPHEHFYTSRGSSSVAENNDSLVFRLKTTGSSILFTGDIEMEAEEDLSHLGNYLRSDILKVPHHGSSSSLTESFLAAIEPSVAVISSGMFNPYGHPHRQTIERLHGKRIYNTSRDGAIKMTSLLNQSRQEGTFVFKIKTFEDYRFKVAENIKDEIRNIGRLFITW